MEKVKFNLLLIIILFGITLLWSAYIKAEVHPIMDSLVASGGYDTISTYSNGFIGVKQDGVWFFIDTTGKELWKDRGYESVGSFSNGFANVKQDGVWFFIDTTGKELWKDRGYDYAWDFMVGFAKVRKGNMEWFIDTTGKEWWDKGQTLKEVEN